jgi:hypothetical protein
MGAHIVIVYGRLECTQGFSGVFFLKRCGQHRALWQPAGPMAIQRTSSTTLSVTVADLTTAPPDATMVRV